MIGGMVVILLMIIIILIIKIIITIIVKVSVWGFVVLRGAIGFRVSPWGSGLQGWGVLA